MSYSHRRIDLGSSMRNLPARSKHSEQSKWRAPSSCGKTWSSMAQGESIVHIDDDAVQPAIKLVVRAWRLKGRGPIS